MSHPDRPPNEILRHRLSSHRFERYVRAVPDGTHASALALYRWNLEVPSRHTRDRRSLADAVRRINDLRNRVAHYEPLFAHDLSAERTRILGVSAQICPRTATWLANESTVLGILSQRPRTNPTTRRRSRRAGRSESLSR